MTPCPNCQASLADDAKFCAKCGKPTHPCPQCGTPAAPGAKFCPKCGHALSGQPEARPAAPPEAPEAPPVPPAKPVAAPIARHAPGGNQRRSLLVFGLLLIVFALALAFYFLRQPPSPEAETPPAAVAAPASEPAAPPATEAPTAPPPVAEPATVSPQPAREAPPPRRERPASPSPEPAPRIRSCNEASMFMAPVCFAEGPQKFWRCAPDGATWNNRLPGCQRDSGRKDGALY